MQLRQNRLENTHAPQAFDMRAGKPEPSERERMHASIRLANMDRLWMRAETEGWGHTIRLWPWPHGEAYLSLMEEQRVYENAYC